MKKYTKLFENMDNEYIKARKTDIEYIKRRVIEKLTAEDEKRGEFNNNTVVVARDLTPSLTASFDKDKISAFVTAIGSRTSHTAIMSRSLGIPAVVGIGEKLLGKYKDKKAVTKDGKEDIFKSQLKAILRASKYGNIKMIYPFISSYEEVIKANKVLEEVKKELDQENIEYDQDMKVGVMIETPAAVMIADKLAKKVDFFSIGTNDLIQYTNAVDRTNEKISLLHNPYHPGVLSLIKKSIEIAHNNDIWIGMCGAAAGNKLLLPILLGSGLDEFSMSAVSIPEIKAEIEKWTRDEAKEIVDDILELNTSQEVKDHLEKIAS